jgi:hypothetical protein
MGEESMAIEIGIIQTVVGTGEGGYAGDGGPATQALIADFRSPKSINILGLLEKLTGTGRPQGDSATKE